MAFVKGVSGNPNGRPKVPSDVTALARSKSKAAVQTLIDLLDAEDDRVRISAANSLLDRGYGKPAQVLSGEGGGPIVLRWESPTPSPAEVVSTTTTITTTLPTISD